MNQPLQILQTQLLKAMFLLLLLNLVLLQIKLDKLQLTQVRILNLPNQVIKQKTTQLSLLLLKPKIKMKNKGSKLIKAKNRQPNLKKKAADKFMRNTAIEILTGVSN